MNAYFLIILAVLLLAFDFVLKKSYQKINGDSVKSGLVYNAFSGVCTAIIFFVVNKFTFNFSWYSFYMAIAISILTVSYTIIGFKILKSGNMAIYTLFLMVGGMSVPYVFGLVCLGEPFSIIYLVGLTIIIVSLVLSGTEIKKTKLSQIALCSVVFLLNGMVSVFSKLHQIEDVHKTISAIEFTALSGVVKAILSGFILTVCGRKENEKSVKMINKKIVLIIAISAVVGGLSYILQLLAASKLPATVLYPFTTGGTVVLTALMGIIFFSEKPDARQWVSMLLCLVGTCMFLK